MQNKNKKIIITGVVIILVLLIILFTLKLINIEKNEEKEVSNINQNTIENNIIENKIENENTENIVLENTEYEEDNERNLIETSQPVGEEEITKTEIEKKENDEEKAIRIAQENWEQGGNVNFTHEGIENGKHIVYVRDAETHHIATYIINLETETFEME